MKKISGAMVLALALALSGAAIAAAIPAYVSQAVADTTRPKTDTDRDALRLPARRLCSPV